MSLRSVLKEGCSFREVEMSGARVPHVSKKQAEYLFPKVLEAMRNDTRREILAALSREPEREVAYSELKSMLPAIRNGSLTHHLRVLQMADLVKRTVRLEDRINNPDPHYCFYSITEFGRYINEQFWAAVEKGSQLVSSA